MVRNVLGSSASKAVSVMVSFALVPLILGGVGPQQYGLWLAIASVLSFITLFDFGVGNALIGHIAKHRDDRQKVGELIVSSTFFLILITSMSLLMFYLLRPCINWAWLLGNDLPLSIDIAQVATAVFAVVSLTILLSIAPAVRAGLQEGHRNSYYSIAGQLMNLLFAWMGVEFELDLASLIVLSSLGSILSGAVNLLILLRRFRPKLQKLTINNQSRLFFTGWEFFVLQILGLLSYNLDSVIIAKYVGLGDVAQYGVLQKIFAIPSIVLSMIYAALWPAYADALARKDERWISMIYRKSLVWGLFFAIFTSSVLFFSLDYFLLLLSSGALIIDSSAATGMYVLGCLSAIGGATSSLMNGMHQLRAQIYIGILATVVNVSVSLYLVQRVGLAGPIWGTAIALLLTYPLLVFICSRKIASVRSDG